MVGRIPLISSTYLATVMTIRSLWQLQGSQLKGSHQQFPKSVLVVQSSCVSLLGLVFLGQCPWVSLLRSGPQVSSLPKVYGGQSAYVSMPRSVSESVSLGCSLHRLQSILATASLGQSV